MCHLAPLCYSALLCVLLTIGSSGFMRKSQVPWLHDWHELIYEWPRCPEQLVRAASGASLICLLMLESWDQLICQPEEIISVEKSFFSFLLFRLYLVCVFAGLLVALSIMLLTPHWTSLPLPFVSAKNRQEMHLKESWTSHWPTVHTHCSAVVQHYSSLEYGDVTRAFNSCTDASAGTTVSVYIDALFGLQNFSFTFFFFSLTAVKISLVSLHFDSHEEKKRVAVLWP